MTIDISVDWHVVTADTSQDSLTSPVTSLDDDVKQAITTHVPACVRERQSVITDAREALASSKLRQLSHTLLSFLYLLLKQPYIVGSRRVCGFISRWPNLWW